MKKFVPNDWQKALIGMTIKEASIAADKEGLTLRPIAIDGKEQIVTMELRFDRINVGIKNGLVSDVFDVG